MILVTMIINQLIWLKTRSVQYPNPASVSNHVGPECRTFFSVGKGVMARLHDTKTEYGFHCQGTEPAVSWV